MSNASPAKKTPWFNQLLIMLSLFNFTGCSDNIREASAIEIKALVEQSSDTVWSAPELQQRHFRLTFYGYDTVDYRLAANTDNNAKYFRLLIDANFGLNQGIKIRHYDQARLEDGSVLPSEHRRLETGRCQFFSTMNFSCLYRERVEILIEHTILIAARYTGLNLTLGSAEADYEKIDLPAHYIDGFLLAMTHSPKSLVDRFVTDLKIASHI